MELNDSKNAISETPDKDIRGQAKVINDAVCPICFRQLENPIIVEQITDRYKRQLRTFFGYCHKCRAGFVVVQFKREDRWVIHKFRPAVIVGMDNVVSMSNRWQMMSELPDPAPIVIGPGGEYNQLITPQTENMAAKLRPMREALGRLCEAIDEWLCENDE